ncbi:dCTP deaminase [Halobacterium sp. KA-6]|uniref:dCTP deaminase n=1 Tax=Halobacterium sp. KA-6 TaxID=2896368 RepID=UPI001E452F19|nr:dCTP deaminase [Halobacterium sp. KA-6]MCD2203111.1 dCTP deaminase [Halobacterium sp. KA-6]
MPGEYIVDRVDGIVHEETQVHEYGVDLTVAAVYEVAERGHLDFGGDEFADADLRPLASALRDPDDEYEWWTLKAGTYLVEFNESLREGAPLRVQTRRELRENGAYHPSIVTTELGPMPLTVPEGGVELKENARVSTLMDR